MEFLSSPLRAWEAAGVYSTEDKFQFNWSSNKDGAIIEVGRSKFGAELRTVTLKTNFSLLTRAFEEIFAEAKGNWSLLCAG